MAFSYLLEIELMIMNNENAYIMIQRLINVKKLRSAGLAHWLNANTACVLRHIGELLLNRGTIQYNY